ncbi:MAG: hypothetical protein ACI8P0_002958, partial [Planctomycetaceae bacterium]
QDCFESQPSVLAELPLFAKTSFLNLMRMGWRCAYPRLMGQTPSA